MPTPPSNDPSNLTGNWQATLSATAGASALSGMEGSITQNGAATDQGQFTSSVMRLDGQCFDSGMSVPLQGENKSGALTLTSYAVNGQSVLISAMLDATNQILNGTYAVFSGCGDGAAGSFTAVRYAALTGNYHGELQAISPVTATLNLTQAAVTTGSGTFLLTGSVMLQGGSCSLNGQLAQATTNFVQGSHFELTVLDSAGSGAAVNGTLDPTGANLSDVKVMGNAGSCAGVSATGSLGR
jgi:hypothetical protein